MLFFIWLFKTFFGAAFDSLLTVGICWLLSIPFDKGGIFTFWLILNGLVYLVNLILISD